MGSSCLYVIMKKALYLVPLCLVIFLVGYTQYKRFVAVGNIGVQPGDLTRPNDGFDEWWAVQLERHGQIKKTCMGSVGLSQSTKSQLKGELYNKENHLFNCINAKVGATSIKAIFSNLSGSLRRHMQMQNFDNSSVSFSFVRHPFERLTSAYQNRFVDVNGTLGKKAFLKYYSEVSFANFVDFVINDMKKHCRSFNTCNLNVHWTPFITRCNYCAGPSYTVIGKMETMEQDILYIGQMAGIELKLEHKNIGHGKGSSSELTRKYFSGLKKEVVMELFQLYKVDFEMFGYSIE